jgi:hypothetical protein
MDNPFDQKFSIQAMIGAGVTIIALALMQYFFSQSPSVDEMMVKAASEFNKNCPLMVDQLTRIDNVVALPGKKFQFNETIMSLDTTSIGLEEIKKNLEPQIINNVKTNPGLKLFRDKKITMIHYYKDINGNFLFTISVGPEQYDN